MNISSLGNFTSNLITVFIVGLLPLSFGSVLIGCNVSSDKPETFKLFISNLINAFLTGNKDKGFKSRKPNKLISNEYGTVSGIEIISYMLLL